ncbi:MAG: aminotransferase class V-fold PLP-dependent enzyme [Gemmatimonadaceae bacterium]
MSMNRRDALASLAAIAATGTLRPRLAFAESMAEPVRPLRTVAGSVDWNAVRELFPLGRDWTHLSCFLFVSHPKPVAESIDTFRRKIDADAVWLEDAVLTDAEGRPYTKVKQSLADYVGGDPAEICVTSNTTGGLAMAYQGLRIRRNQEILTTEHDHFSHHESIRYAAERSGATVRYIPLYDTPSTASVSQMAERVARAVRPTTRAVGITWVQSSSGVKTPLKEIADVVARANRGRASANRCLLIVDGVHGFGNQDVDVAKTGIDFFATGTHKWLFAPRGTGFLWGKADAWPELRPTVPSFDPDVFPETWGAWMERKPLPPTRAAFVSPGGFLAYEHVLATPAAVELHHSIGRGNIAARIVELNAQFREGVAKIPGVTLHTPRDPAIAAGINCFEVAGLTPEQVVEKLKAKRFRTTTSPYKVSHARVSAGIMNTPDEIDAVLRAIRDLRT